MTPPYTRRDDPAVHAWTGHFEPLAKHIEAGGELDDEMRAVLIAILRGELRFRKGIRRTFAQMQRDRDADLDIRRRVVAFGLKPSQAKKAWLDDNADVSEDTLKVMLRRADRDRTSRRTWGNWVKVIKSAFRAPD